MTKFTQNLRRAAQFAVSVAGFTVTAPGFAGEELPRGSRDIDHLDYPSPESGHADNRTGRLELAVGSCRIALGIRSSMAGL